MTEPDELAPTIHRAQQGDASAFEELVDAFSARLYGFLFRLTGSRSVAEELVQEVFLRVVRTIGRYQHEGRFKAWIFRIAANLARDRVRRLTRRPRIVSLSGADGDGQGLEDSLGDTTHVSPEHDMALADDVDRLQQAFSRLPEAEREVLLLRHYSDMSFAQIAESMGTPLGTALARSHRALGKLREMMGQEP